jgi:hypothetical protein
MRGKENNHRITPRNTQKMAEIGRFFDFWRYGQFQPQLVDLE